MQELEEVLGDTVPQQGIPDIKFSKVSLEFVIIILWLKYMNFNS